jgi:hypothetical protein
MVGDCLGSWWICCNWGGVGFGCVYDKAFKGLLCIVVVVGGG